MRKWYALYVKMNHEKKIAARFMKMGVEYFLPIQTVIRQWSDRKKKIEQVVIPMMIFVRLEESERASLLQDPSAISYLTLRGTSKPAVIPDREMERFIFMFDYSDTTISFCTAPLCTGNKVRIIKGPLYGLEGELIEFNKKYQVGLYIPQLGYATVEIPVGYLSLIKK